MTQARNGSKIPVFDGDSHVLEPPEVWERYLDPEYRVAARSVFWRQEGDVSPVTTLNGEIAHELYYHPDGRVPLPMPPGQKEAHVNIPRQGVWRPGMTVEQIGSLDPTVRHPVNPGGSDPEVRLRDMDQMGVDQALLFPTYFAEYFPLVTDAPVAEALARAYNDWIFDFCQTAPDRLFPVAVLPVQEINATVRELRRVAGKGFRAAFVRPVFVKDRFPHHPYYYPMWKELEELGVVYCSHPSWGYNAPEMDSEATFVERVMADSFAGHPMAEVVAPAMDNGVLLVGMMAEGLLEKFPKIKFSFVHSKASWLHLFLEKTEGYLWLSNQVDPVSLKPDKVFFNRTTLINFSAAESAIWELHDLFESVGSWGSLYPNHDTLTAWEAIDALEQHGVPGVVVRKLMGENQARVLGVELAAHAKSISA